MNRSDERRQIKDEGASMARSPSQARRDEEPHVTEEVSREHDERDPAESTDGGAAQARSPARARAAEERSQSEQKRDMKEDREEVSGGREIMHEHVDADHVMGTGGKVGVKSAEGESDMASAKANRKEADEPEREHNEEAAMGRERSVPAKNVIGHGERETVARHTI